MLSLFRLTRGGEWIFFISGTLLNSVGFLILGDILWPYSLQYYSNLLQLNCWCIYLLLGVPRLYIVPRAHLSRPVSGSQLMFKVGFKYAATEGWFLLRLLLPNLMFGLGLAFTATAGLLVADFNGSSFLFLEKNVLSRGTDTFFFFGVLSSVAWTLL